jgi:AcrR family transcriptional regulator
MVPPEPDTKEKILDAAEELFAEQGFLNTSLRAITQQAGVNLAAVNYHFGSKDALLLAVFERFVAPMNESRLALLDEAEATAGPEGPSVEAVAHAFLHPMTRVWTDPALWTRRLKLMARAIIELGPKFEELKQHLFSGIFRRFLPALGRAAPHLEQSELVWRFHFIVGAMNFAFHARGQSEAEGDTVLPQLSDDHVPEMLELHMVTTFRAPAVLSSTPHGTGTANKGVGR